MFKFLPTNVLIDFFIARGHRLELTITKQLAIYQNLFTLAKFDTWVEQNVLKICKLDMKDTRREGLLTRVIVVIHRKKGSSLVGCAICARNPWVSTSQNCKPVRCSTVSTPSTSSAMPRPSVASPATMNPMIRSSAAIFLERGW
jgi:hypothetical protein